MPDPSRDQARFLTEQEAGVNEGCLGGDSSSTETAREGSYVLTPASSEELGENH